MKIGFQKKVSLEMTMPEIICDLFSFLSKDQIERIQLVNQFWNNTIIRHKNILPLREFSLLDFDRHQIDLYATLEDRGRECLVDYKIKFDGTNLNEIEGNELPSRHSYFPTVDELLTNLNDVVFETIQVICEDNCDDFLKWIKPVTEKTGGRFRFRGKLGNYFNRCIGYKLDEIFDNYIIVDELALIIKVGTNSNIAAFLGLEQLPSTPKEIRLNRLDFKDEENGEVFDLFCNGKLNGANRLTIPDWSITNHENFIGQWFELYRTHENPISLVGKFEFLTVEEERVLDVVKTFLNNTQLDVKYSLSRNHIPFHQFTNQCLTRSCVLHETDSYALVMEMKYEWLTDMSNINASDLDQPPRDKMKNISFCVKPL